MSVRKSKPRSKARKGETFDDVVKRHRPNMDKLLGAAKHAFIRVASYWGHATQFDPNKTAALIDRLDRLDADERLFLSIGADEIDPVPVQSKATRLGYTFSEDSVSMALVTEDGQAVEFDSTGLSDFLVIALQQIALDKHATGGRIDRQVSANLREAFEHLLEAEGEFERIQERCQRSYDRALKSQVDAASKLAEERAIERVKTSVQKLARAAQMPAGVERAVMLEECQELIRKSMEG